MLNLLHKSERGSVSIFLIIIITVIFFFNAILIDYSRIISASYQAERAVKAAVRSTLASYDTELYNNYGLFGFSGHESEIFDEILKINLSKPIGGINFTSFNIEERESSITNDFELGNHSVIKQQILEEMKYKAPIDFTIDIIDQFSSLSLVMKETSNTTSILTEIYEQYEMRNKSLSNAIGFRKEASEFVSNNTNKQLEEITANYYNYQNSVEELVNLSNDFDSEDENKIKKRKNELERNIIEYKQEAISLSEQIYNYYLKNSNDHNVYLNNAEVSIEKAQNFNEEMKKTINNANSEVNNNYYESFNNDVLDEIENTNKTLNNIKNINENISKNQNLPLPDDYFTRFKDDIFEQKQIYLDFLTKLELLPSKVAIAFNSSSINDLNILKDDISNQLSKYDEFFIDYSNPKNKTVQKEKELNYILQEVESKKISLENQGKLSLDGVLELINSVGEINSQNSDFAVLNQKFNKYIDYNNSIKTDNITNYFNNLPDETIKKATNEMDSLFSELGNIIKNIRNDIYIEEYTFARFNHINPSEYSNIISNDSGNIKFDENILLDLLDVSNQEIEYIIYGLGNAGENFSSALRDIFLMRLAINLIEAFSSPAVLAATNPLVILLEATIYSILTSTIDLINILKGEDVPLAKKINMVSYDYRNYLRILYFIRGTEIDKLSRIEAVIDYKSDKDLTLIPTYAVGNLNISMDLWFLPGVINAFNYVGILDGQVDKNRYFINKKAAFIY